MGGEGDHWELCKKFKLDHTDKWYMHNPETVQENWMHKIIWNFEIQTDHPISARILDLAVPADHEVRLKENKKRDK